MAECDQSPATLYDSVFLYEQSESEPRASASGHVEVRGKVTQKLQACSIVFILDCGDPAPLKKLLSNNHHKSTKTRRKERKNSRPHQRMVLLSLCVFVV